MWRAQISHQTKSILGKKTKTESEKQRHERPTKSQTLCSIHMIFIFNKFRTTPYGFSVLNFIWHTTNTVWAFSPSAVAHIFSLSYFGMFGFDGMPLTLCTTAAPWIRHKHMSTNRMERPNVWHFTYQKIISYFGAAECNGATIHFFFRNRSLLAWPCSPNHRLSLILNRYACSAQTNEWMRVHLTAR